MDYRKISEDFDLKVLSYILPQNNNYLQRRINDSLVNELRNAYFEYTDVRDKINESPVFEKQVIKTLDDFKKTCSHFISTKKDIVIDDYSSNINVKDYQTSFYAFPESLRVYRGETSMVYDLLDEYRDNLKFVKKYPETIDEIQKRLIGKINFACQYFTVNTPDFSNMTSLPLRELEKN